VRGHGAEAQPEGVHPLNVDGRHRGLDLAGNLDRDRDAAAGDTDDHRRVELERSDSLGQGVPGARAITEERRDPRNEAHAPIVPGPRASNTAVARPRKCAVKGRKGGFAAGVGKEYGERRNDRG
jgi:hypothetical protein